MSGNRTENAMKEMKRVGTVARVAFVMSAVALMGVGCAAEPDAEAYGESADEIRVTSSFTSRGTGYYPDASPLEGGFVDRVGKPLRTLQQFLAGNAAYVSVAMDTNAFKYGTRLRIRELETKYGRSIVFRVVDTGGAFRGKGRTRIDICTQNNKASLDPTINGTLHIDVIDEKAAGTLEPVDDPTDPDNTPAPAPGGSSGSGGSTSGGATCSFDGACNPGNNGAGLICQSGRCVKGCRRDNQCPGSLTCKSGQCQ
jgi:3D (Asp-Asp-Asp) domain-containing protein